jgi:hypothetical protein
MLCFPSGTALPVRVILSNTHAPPSSGWPSTIVDAHTMLFASFISTEASGRMSGVKDSS